MLKFFRKIRQQLIDEGNLKKYFFYAIGEILLVMIGIILALQVNNWKADFDEQKISKTYLKELKKESQKDLKRLEGFIKNAQEYINKVEQYYLSKRQSSHKITKKDLDKIGIVRQTFFMNEETYHEIISNGHLNLIPNQVKTNLLELHTKFRTVNKIDDKMAMTVNAQHLKMGGFFEVIRLEKTSQYEMQLSNNSDRNLAILTYKNYVNVSHDWMKTQLFFYGTLKNKYQDLIKSIDENSL